MKINDVSKLTGITVRALHYYDQIGLLKPVGKTEAGYRIYDENDLQILQQILFFKELDFSLEEIKDIMKGLEHEEMRNTAKSERGAKSSCFRKSGGSENTISDSEREIFMRQRKLLMEKRDRLDGIIGLVDTILKGEKDMSFKQFDESAIEAERKKYAAEIKERWGNTDAYKECEKKTGNYDNKKWGNMTDGMNEILKEFGEAHTGNKDRKGAAPESTKAQELVVKWQKYITDNMYECTDDILDCLGQMYTADERFKDNIDKYGAGTAQFMADAIKVHCGK